MKILMIAPEPFFEPRGTPISVLQRLRALSRLGHSVDLVTYHVGEDVQIPGVTLHRIPPVPFVHRVKPGPSWVKLILDGLVFARALGRLCRERYHVIHSHEEASFFAMILAALFRTRHLYDMHSSLPKQLENFGFHGGWPVVQLFAWLERAVLHTCDAVITIGEDLESYVKSINPRVRTRTIENLAIGLDHETAGVSPSVDEVRKRFEEHGYHPVVYTGTFERYQGLETLLECAGILARESTKTAFLLVGGKASQIRALEALVRRKGLDDVVVFTGPVSLDDALSYLQLAEILVSPRIDGTSVPLKIYSYLHAEKPILATKVPAHTQVLNDEIALLVDPSAQALASGILRLMGDPALRQNLARRAKEHALKHYDPFRYVAELDRLYSGLLPPVPRTDPAVHPTEN